MEDYKEEAHGLKTGSCGNKRVPELFSVIGLLSERCFKFTFLGPDRFFQEIHTFKIVAVLLQY